MPEYHSLPRRELAKKTLEIISTYKLTAFIAPMGYGKTTLAESVADLASGKVYFYSVPDGAHDAGFLWHDMFSRFEEQGMDVAPAIRRIGFPETAAGRRDVLTLLRGLTRQNTRAYLFIDDYQWITDSAFGSVLDSVALAAIPGFHIVLLSRARPDMRLEELHIKHLAMFYEQDFLAFSEAETEEYFRLNGIPESVAADAAKDAWRFSEGWPAALWLCLQNLRNGNCAQERPFERPHASDSIESLMRKVFSGYDAEEQDLLLCLSVPDSFTEHDAIQLRAVPQTSARLWALRKKNALLSLNGKTGYFRFHSIFLSFLRKEFARATHLDKSALYRVAGECCAERQERISAIRLFAVAGRDEDLRRILDMFLAPEYDQALAFFQEETFAVADAIPWHVRLQNPVGWLAFVNICLMVWNDSRAFPMLDEAEARFRDAPEISAFLKKRLQGEIATLRGIFAFNDLRELRDRYTEAYALLNGPSALLCKGSAWGFGSPSGSFIAIRDRGAYKDAVAQVTQIWPLCSTLTNGAARGGDKILLCEYALERGDFASAAPLAEEVSLICGKENKHMPSVLASAFCLARLHMVSGDAGGAVRVLEDLRPQLERLDIFDHFECLDLAAGYINAGLGRLEAVPQWLRDGEILDPPHNALPQLAGFGLTVHAKALLLQGDYRRVSALAAEIPACTAPLDCLFAHIHGKTLKAIAAWHTSGQNEALTLLREALDFSRPDGIILPLAEYGGHIVPLLRLHKRAMPGDTHLAAVLSLAENIAHASECLGNEKALLSPRELEVMRYVVVGMSNTAIADKLGVSSETVKKALVRTYRKLRAANRAEAARRFMELHGDCPLAPPGF